MCVCVCVCVYIKIINFWSLKDNEEDEDIID